MTKRSPRWAVVATRLTMLALAFGVVVGLAIVGTSIAGAVSGDHHVALHQKVDLDKIASLPANAVTSQAVPVTIELRDVTNHQLLLATARDLLPIVLGLPILWFLLGIVGSVRDGDPFVGANVRRLRGIGLVLLIGFPLAGALASMLEQALADTTLLNGAGTGTGFAVSATGPLISLGVFVLAEVFAYGLRLREDVEGTI